MWLLPCLRYQVNYLEQDCKDALTKIRIALKNAGAVDLPPGSTQAPVDTITLPEGGSALGDDWYMDELVLLGAAGGPNGAAINAFTPGKGGAGYGFGIARPSNSGVLSQVSDSGTRGLSALVSMFDHSVLYYPWVVSSLSFIAPEFNHCFASLTSSRLMNSHASSLILLLLTNFIAAAILHTHCSDRPACATEVFATSIAAARSMLPGYLSLSLTLELRLLHLFPAVVYAASVALVNHAADYTSVPPSQDLSEVFGIHISTDNERFDDEDDVMMFGSSAAVDGAAADAALAWDLNDLDVERLRAAPSQVDPTGPLGVLGEMLTPGASDGMPTIGKGEGLWGLRGCGMAY